MSLPDLTLVTGFEWDAGNQRKNEKHGVTREEAEAIFTNRPLIVLQDERHSEEESRFRALGRTVAGRRIYVTFTMRANGTLIRVISARPMSRKERVEYASEEIEADAPLSN